MNLLQLFEGIYYKRCSEVCQMERLKIRGIEADSRKVNPGYIYVCIVGYKTDGHQYIQEAVKNGAIAIVVQKQVEITTSAVIIEVENTRNILALLAANFYRHPAEKMKMIGITGTKGKTTCTYMIREVLENAGYQVGLIGTIETIIDTKHSKANHTTPDALELQRTLYEMVQAGCEIVVMEVSSQGLKLKRVEGIIFDIGVFTNLGEDHVGIAEHMDIAEYLGCKARLFQQCKLGIGNVDDDNMEQIFERANCELITYGIHREADIQGQDIEPLLEENYIGVRYDVVQQEKKLSIDMRMPGKFNVYNSLASIAVCFLLGIKEACIQKAMKKVQVKGRMERVEIPYPFTILIDYAHNAMSLENALLTLKEYPISRLVVIFGCGGNRAKSRRVEMGEVAGRLADFTILTSDNPRYEEPEDIIDDIEVGISQITDKYIRIVNRKEAIQYAIEHGEIGDVIVLAGKGHEDYQEIEGVKYPMNEWLMICDVVKELDKIQE